MSLLRLRCVVVIFVASVLLLPTRSIAQDSSPSRFEAGGSFTAVRGTSFSGDMGPGVEGDVNFGRHLAFDAAFNWLPASFSHTVNGFFGAKIGTRTQHFGFFGKVRPGFFSTAYVLRGATLNLDTLEGTSRFGRLTERALDAGGVVEFYASRHWLMRWDLGDTLLFEDPTIFTITGTNAPPSISSNRGTTNHLQFSTSVHWRF
jgi:hypothetical protein